MKKIFLIALLGCAALGSQAQFSKAELQATGLTCAMCSNAINKALQAVPFVANVKSDIGKASFQVQFREGMDVDIDVLKKAVEDAGFSVGALKLTGTFHDVKVENDKHIAIGNTEFHFLNVENRVLHGEETVTVVDKGFVTAKQFKKISAATRMACLQTGRADACCVKDGIPSGTRIYHVTI